MKIERGTLETTTKLVSLGSRGLHKNASHLYNLPMHVILFDIDGTLVNTGGAGRDALHWALTTEFAVADPFQVNLSGRTDRGITRELFDAHAIPHTDENWQRFQQAYLVGLLDHLPRRKGYVLPGVVALLHALRNTPDVALGLLTGNVREGARRKLAFYGLEEHFAFGGFGDHQHDRDDVAREALVASRLHVGEELASDRIWVIGDTPLDVRCARAIGAKVVAVATGSHPIEELELSRPDLAVDDLTATEKLLARLFG